MAYTSACTDTRATLTPLMSVGARVRHWQSAKDYGLIRGDRSFPWMIAVGKYTCGLDSFWSLLWLSLFYYYYLLITNDILHVNIIEPLVMKLYFHVYQRW